MLVSIALWLLGAVLILWILLDPVSRISRALYEIIIPLISSNPIELKSKFGEWAGKLIDVVII